MNKKTQCGVLFTSFLLMLSGSVTAVNISALGNHYGIMLANYAMVENLQSHCENLRPVDIPVKSVADTLLRAKVGEEAYKQMLIEMQSEAFDVYAHKQSEEVWSMLQACDSPRMEAVLKHIEGTHHAAYSALKSTPDANK